MIELLGIYQQLDWRGKKLTVPVYTEPWPATFQDIIFKTILGTVCMFETYNQLKKQIYFSFEERKKDENLKEKEI